MLNLFRTKIAFIFRNKKYILLFKYEDSIFCFAKSVFLPIEKQILSLGIEPKVALMIITIEQSLRPLGHPLLKLSFFVKYIYCSPH